MCIMGMNSTLCQIKEDKKRIPVTAAPAANIAEAGGAISNPLTRLLQEHRFDVS